MAQAAKGVNVVINARSAGTLAEAAAEIRAATPGVSVSEGIGDITDPAIGEALSAACPAPDILIDNAGGPSPGDFRDWDRDT